MTIKTIDTENITPEMFADISTAYLFEKDNWPLVAIKAVLEAAPAVEPSRWWNSQADQYNQWGSLGADEQQDFIRSLTAPAAEPDDNAEIIQPDYGILHPSKDAVWIDAETRALAIDVCNYILIRDKLQGFEAIDTAEKLKKLLGAE